ncbi:MAG: hypothetical protein IT355_04465 [Gemmatimonadaceae bacterium]|nr:hypothetical protein [Gemmatimonadaceae bacterium]
MKATRHAAPAAALRALLAEVVDYAGLFPPASLDMHSAVANYAAYRAGPQTWMLGRFVVPATRLDELESAIAALTQPERDAWHGARLSVLLTGGFAAETAAIEAFDHRAPHGVRIDVAEGRTADPDTVLAMAASMPDDVTLYCELPHRDDPLPLLLAVQSARARAKLRTGGVTPDAFPAPAEIVRFLRRCHETGVTAKATAGLHHPLRAEYRLTYAPEAPRGVMYGYLNLFLCAAVIAAGGDDAVAEGVLLVGGDGVTGAAFKGTGILNGGEAGAFKIPVPLNGGVSVEFTGAEILIARGDAVLMTLDAVQLARTRREALVAFGSCSFREPVDELTALGLPGATAHNGTDSDD